MAFSSRVLAFGLLLFVASMAACDEGNGEGGNPSFYLATIQPIWDENCVTACHDSQDPLSANPELSLDGDAYDALVDVPSIQVSTMAYVEPGDPDNSYLWHKLNNTQASVGGTGISMPNGQDFLPAADLKKIEDWILDGAPR